MKKIIIKIFKWIWYLILLVGGFGLIIALIGFIFKNDSLYFWGLLFSSPFYLVVLPCCLLLMVIGSFYGIVRESRSALHKKHSNSKDEREIDDSLAENWQQLCQVFYYTICNRSQADCFNSSNKELVAIVATPAHSNRFLLKSICMRYILD